MAIKFVSEQVEHAGDGDERFGAGSGERTMAYRRKRTTSEQPGNNALLVYVAVCPPCPRASYLYILLPPRC